MGVRTNMGLKSRFFDSTLATETSWFHPFEGETVIALRKYIDKYYDPSESSGIHVHYFSFVNSTGTGKSRTIDELGKELLVIPLNLALKGSTGLDFLCPEHINNVANGSTQGFLLETVPLVIILAHQISRTKLMNVFAHFFAHYLRSFWIT